jgi:hypothetical protein
MAQAEHVGDKSQSDQCGVAGGKMQVQTPTGDVQTGDEAIQNGQTPPFRRGEGCGAANLLQRWGD